MPNLSEKVSVIVWFILSLPGYWMNAMAAAQPDSQRCDHWPSVTQTGLNRESRIGKWLSCSCCYGLSWFSTYFLLHHCYPDRHDHKLRRENEEEVVHKREEVTRITTYLWAGTVRVIGEQMSSAITSLLQFGIKRLVTLQTQQNIFVY